MEFQWNDENIREWALLVSKKFNNPNENGGWKGYEIEVDTFKKSKEPKRDYEILSYSYNNRVYTKNNLGEFSTGFDASVHLLILHPENMTEIHSVKRLSDGQVFSVDEKVYLKESDGKCVFYINEFTIKDGQCFACSGISIMQLDKSSIQPIESKEQEGYEILSLKYEKDKRVYPFTYLPNGVYIYSVKRLSDGEVFRVGDLVKWNLERNDQTPFLIESFEENHMLPFKDRMFCNNKNIDICYLEKVPQQTTKGESPIAFERELQMLINNHSKENDSNTPDYILANFLSNCLKAFNGAVILKDANLGL